MDVVDKRSIFIHFSRLYQAKRSESNEVNESDVKKDAKALLEVSICSCR